MMILTLETGSKMEASKVTVGSKVYDFNYLNKTKKTNLRRKLIVEYIQSKPAGEYIKMSQLQEVAKLSSTPNANAFVKRMIRDGIIMRHDGHKPKSFYYSVIGSVRTVKPKAETPVATSVTPDLNGFVESMTKLGVKFTITISNEATE